MEYKRIGDKIVFRLEMGDRLMESAQKIAANENVKLASISGIGACSKIEMGYIDLSIKEYIFKTFEGNMEILQATGNITLKDGEPFPHIHISVANEECKAFGGHLNEATISATFEGIMQIIDHEIHREFNEDLGLALMNVCSIK
jgi:predicted DNA-binding protein with PD1-like motif|tara:strand:+ start:114 stop:545 length:432 start_codon:yes stop_codon:yes gene_type:complete